MNCKIICKIICGIISEIFPGSQRQTGRGGSSEICNF